jgi:beta-glucosidase
MVSDSIVDLRAMRELYLYAFEQVVTCSKPQAVMASYNKINGSYACENEFLLHDLLYGEWNFQGAVISDWYALNNAVQSVKAGLSLEMPAAAGCRLRSFLTQLMQTNFRNRSLDRAVEKVLSLVLRMNCANSVYSLYDTDANHRLSTDIAADCIVLLKNKQDILPLQEDEQIALIGDLSVFPRLQGSGSSKVNPIFTQNLKNEIENYTGHVICAQGYSLSDARMNESLLEEAIEVAETADKGRRPDRPPRRMGIGRF